MSEPARDLEFAAAAGVPDHPVKLPDGWRACAACGVPVEVDDDPVVIEAFSRVGDPPLSPDHSRSHLRVEMGTCPSCRDRSELAMTIVARFPRMVARLGPWGAQRRVELALMALACLGRPMPSPRLEGFELGVLLSRLAGPGASLEYSGLFAPVQVGRPGYASPFAWAHVLPSARLALRVGYGELLADRVAVSRPSVVLPPPQIQGDGIPVQGGCLMCGAVPTRTALEVQQLGGPVAARRELWTSISASGDALGQPGLPMRLSGFTCPDCTLATERHGVGMTAVERACEGYLRSVGRGGEADLVVTGTAEAVAWGAMVAARKRRNGSGWGVNDVPWAHLCEPVP